VNYDEEHWIKVYTRDTAGWLSVTWQARGLALEIARKLPKKTGELSLGRRGLEALSGLLRAPWSEIEPFIQELIADGRLEYDAERQVIRDPGHVVRQGAIASGAERTRRWRGAKAANDASPESSRRDAVTRGVTPRDAVTSHGDAGVTPRDQEKRREEKRDPPNPLTGEPGSARRVNAGTALSTEVCEAYQRAIAAETKTPYALPAGRGPRDDLLSAINAHAPPDAPAARVLEWVRAEASDWVQQHRGREAFTGGWAPRHFLGWLNGGKKPPAETQRTGTEGGASARARRDLMGYEP
jgi:hypothetical protein